MNKTIKKHRIALFINTGTKVAPVWARIKKSTELTLALNPETEEYDYIADENPTTELEKYAPEIEQALKMIKDEPDFEYFWNIFYNLYVGDDAKTEAMVVFQFDETESGSETYYKAWKTDCTVVMDELNAVDSELSFNINFSGTLGRGYATVLNGVPTFVSSIESE